MTTDILNKMSIQVVLLNLLDSIGNPLDLFSNFEKNVFF